MIIQMYSSPSKKATKKATKEANAFQESYSESKCALSYLVSYIILRLKFKVDNQRCKQKKNFVNIQNFFLPRNCRWNKSVLS